MKTLFSIQVFLLTLILFVTVTIAQITITSADVSAINALGNVITNHFDSLATSVDIGSQGATSWDFSTLTSNNTNTFTSVTPSSTPYHSSYFPNSNVVFSYKILLVADTVDSWQYTTQNIGDYLMDGSITESGTNLTRSVYLPAQLYFPLPYTFNDQWSSDFTNFTTMYFNIGGISIVGTVTYYHTETVKVDAWGNMKMPGGVFIPALRLRRDDKYTSASHSYHSITYSFFTRSGDMVEVTAVDSNAANNGIIQTNGVIWRSSKIVGVNTEDQMPTEYSLSQNYPNPFNPTTTIRFHIPNFSFVNLKVYDFLGSEVATLVNEEKPTGSYEIKFDASQLSSGIYFYKLQAGKYTETKKMILLK
jgi:hypothetical protein